MLNTPSQQQAAHSARLCTEIADTIASSGGWIGFDRFMELALYAPGLGYYRVGTEKIGERGDFITAPMISSLFGQCLGRQFSDILTHCDPTRPRSIVEFGAGTGQLMLDILNYLQSVGNLPDEYVVVETSPDLQQRQRRLLDQSGHLVSQRAREIVRWAEYVDSDINGIIIANELLDALPVKVFQMGEDHFAREVGVIWSNKSMNFNWQVSDHLLAEEINRKLNSHNLEPGYRSEVGLRAEAWVRSVGECLHTGTMILIDYGFADTEFYHWDRNKGTLMCHHQHQVHDDPFCYPGLQDITAHIDFSAIAEAGRDVGLDLSGYCSQGNFLMSLGLIEAYEKILMKNNRFDDASAEISTLKLAQAIKKLTMPQEMGEIFKVIAFSRNYNSPMRGFDMQNNKERL